MIAAEDFMRTCVQHGFTYFTGTPCSFLKPLINGAISWSGTRFIRAVNEGDGIAIAAGVRLAGGKAVVMFQNSGLGNAVNPLTSLLQTFRIPVLGIVTHRGAPGIKDEPQHELMGKITTDLLDLMQIPWREFPKSNEELAPAFAWADGFLKRGQTVFFLMAQGDVADFKLKPMLPAESAAGVTATETDLESRLAEPQAMRFQALQVIKEIFAKNPLIATTGKTGRELYELGDAANQFYMVGSMGCVLPLAIGVALQKPQTRICVIDGDGALLMRMGNLATTGGEDVANIVHVLLDNEVHDSTGGQSSGSAAVQFTTVAQACGYARVISPTSLSQLQETLLHERNGHGSVFVHFKIKPGAPPSLGRPGVTPPEQAERFAQFLAGLN